MMLDLFGYCFIVKFVFVVFMLVKNDVKGVVMVYGVIVVDMLIV